MRSIIIVCMKDQQNYYQPASISHTSCKGKVGQNKSLIVKSMQKMGYKSKLTLHFIECAFHDKELENSHNIHTYRSNALFLALHTIKSNTGIRSHPQNKYNNIMQRRWGPSNGLMDGGHNASLTKLCTLNHKMVMMELVFTLQAFRNENLQDTLWTSTRLLYMMMVRIVQSLKHKIIRRKTKCPFRTKHPRGDRFIKLAKHRRSC